MARLGPGHLLAAAVGFAVGLALGGLGPREELRTARAEAREAKRAPGGAGREIARIFQGRPVPEAEAPEPAEVPDDVVEPDDRPRAPDPETREAMREAMRVRQELARAALVEDAEPTDAQLDDLDAVVADMNAELRALATDFVGQFAEADPTRRDMMVFAADTLDVLIETEDRLAATLTEEQRADLSEESLDPLSYVDESIVDVLGELDR
jgi:hypothetical protein